MEAKLHELIIERIENFTKRRDGNFSTKDNKSTSKRALSGNEVTNKNSKEMFHNKSIEVGLTSTVTRKDNQESFNKDLKIETQRTVIGIKLIKFIDLMEG